MAWKIKVTKFLCVHYKEIHKTVITTRNIGAPNKVMGRRNFQESISVQCFHKLNVSLAY